MALGNWAYATAMDSFVMGNNARVDQANSVAVAVAYAQLPNAMLPFADTVELLPMIWAPSSVVSKWLLFPLTLSIAIGNGSESNGTSSAVIGSKNIVNSDDTYVWGTNNGTINSKFSSVMGNNNHLDTTEEGAQNLYRSIPIHYRLLYYYFLSLLPHYLQLKNSFQKLVHQSL